MRFSSSDDMLAERIFIGVPTEIRWHLNVTEACELKNVMQ